MSFRTDMAKPKRDVDVDIANFTSALRRILIEFRTDKKDTPGKHREKIDHVAVGGNSGKRDVFAFLLNAGVIYADHKYYLIDKKTMKSLELSMHSVCELDEKSALKAYGLYCQWKKGCAR